MFVIIGMLLFVLELLLSSAAQAAWAGGAAWAHSHSALASRAAGDSTAFRRCRRRHRFTRRPTATTCVPALALPANSTMRRAAKGAACWACCVSTLLPLRERYYSALDGGNGQSLPIATSCSSRVPPALPVPPVKRLRRLRSLLHCLFNLRISAAIRTRATLGLFCNSPRCLLPANEMYGSSADRPRRCM